MSTPEPEASSKVDPDTGCTSRQRFLLELEFFQCLANPNYLNFLAQSRYLEDPAFLAFLDYLQYWKRPEYAKFLVYPQALYFLDMLKNPDFRKAIAHPNYKDLINQQQYYSWLYYRRNRIREM